MYFIIFFLVIFITNNSAQANSQLLISTQLINVGHIFEKDDRNIVEPSVHPYNKILKLQVNRTSCSAALIAEDIIVTNFHCIQEAFEFNAKYGWKQKSSIKVNAGKLKPNGEWENQTQVQKIILIPQSNTYSANEDWAVLKIAKKWGKDWGYFSLYDWPGMNYKKNRPFDFEDIHSMDSLDDISLVGFSGDIGAGNLLSEHQNCSIIVADQGLLFHDCDSSSGSSGAPIFSCQSDDKNSCILYGINQGDIQVKEKKELTNWSLNFSNIGIASLVFKVLVK